MHNLKDILLCISPEEELGFTTALLFDCLFPAPAFLCFLKSRITETCSRASSAARLITKCLRPKWLLLYQGSHSWFSFSGNLVTCVLITPIYKLNDSRSLSFLIC